MNASTKKFTLPDRNVLAGGLASLAAFLIVGALRRFDYDVPLDYALMLVAIIGPTVSYLVPPSITDFLARLDAVVRQAAADPHTPPRETVETAGAVVKQAVAVAAKSKGS